jgi:hypothetical protein
MTELKDDLDMEPYFSAWEKQKKALENMPLPEVDLKKLRKWHRRSPRQKLLRREVACLIAGLLMFVFFLCHYQKGVAMPVPYIMTLLVCVLCVADSIYALRLIALANPVTSSIPDMLKNCAKLRLFEKIEILAALVVVAPMSVFFLVPAIEWIWNSVNFYSEVFGGTFSWAILLTGVLSGVLVGIYIYRSNLRIIKGTINELRTYRNQN